MINYLVSVLRRDDVSINGNIGFGEEASECGEFEVGFGIGAMFWELRRGFGCYGSAIADGEEREFGIVRFEFVEKW